MRYIKICPRCGKENDELADSCSYDGEFLGMVPATPAPDSKPDETPAKGPGEVPHVKKQNKRFAPGGPTAAVNTRVDQQRRKEAERRAALESEECGVPTPEPEPEAPLEPLKTLYLESGAGQVFEVREGYVVGQTHPSSCAQIQLADLPGIGYVHRNHCSFSFQDDAWRVTAIQQPGYTNPTMLNHKRIGPGESKPLHNGDRLTLSGVTLNIRIIEL